MNYYIFSWLCFLFKVIFYERSNIINDSLLFLELKLNTKQNTVKEGTHLNNDSNKNLHLQIRKNK